MRRMVVAMLCALALPLMGGTYQAPGEITGPWDQEVDLSRTANACESIQSALRAYISGQDTNPRIRIYGEATVSNSNLHTARYKNLSTTAVANSVYKYCFAEIPSGTFEGQYPVSDGDSAAVGPTNFDGIIYFDNAKLTYACSGQTVPTVIWQMGDNWLAGRTSSSDDSPYGGDFSFAPTLKGQLDIAFTGDCDGSKTEGTTFSRSPDNLFSESTVSVAVWLNGVNRRDAMDLSMRIKGRTDDKNDIGIWHDGDFSGMNRFGDTRVLNMALGRLFTANIIADWFGGYLSSNLWGIWLGDPTYGGDIVNATTCVAGTVPIASTCGYATSAMSSLRIHGGVVEGNQYGELVAFDSGSGNVFLGTHFEGVNAMKGHAMLLGAGVCSGGTRDGMVAGTAADCPSGSVVLPKSTYGGTRSFSDIRFVGGAMAGDKGCVTGASACGGATALSDWGGLMIGAGANDVNGRITIAASLLSSSILISAASVPVGFQFATELGSGNLPLVDVSNAVRTGNLYWPAYAQIWGEEVNIPFGIDGSVTLNNYFDLTNINSTALVASTSYAGFVPLPRNEENRWQVHRLDFTTSEAYAGTDSCNFIPALSNTSQGTIAAISGSTATLSGTTIAANTTLEHVFTPDATLLTSPSDNDHLVGVQVTSGATCDEMHGKGVLTLLRLK